MSSLDWNIAEFPAKPVLHFHIGAVNVFPDLIATTAAYLRSSGSQKRIALLSNTEFGRYIFNAIRTGDDKDAKPFVAELAQKGDAILCARPSFLREIDISFLPVLTLDIASKLINFQNLFSDFRINFHYVLEDHVKHLCRFYQKITEKPAAEIRPSWLSLINDFELHLLSDHSITLWVSRDPKLMVMQLASYISGQAQTRIPMVENSDIDLQKWSQALLDMADQGLDLEHLDDLYDQDIEDLRGLFARLPAGTPVMLPANLPRER